MEINKETLYLREVVFRTGSNVMVEGDIILPDVKPDIREILLADATVNNHTEERRGDKLHISGNVQFHLLYHPDSTESELKSFQAILPFSDSVDVPDGDISFVVRVTTEHIGFSQINSRKLSAKVIVSLQVRGYKNIEIAPISSLPDKRIQCRSEEFHVSMPICETKNDVVLSDLLTVPSHLPDIDEILKTTATVSGVDYKMMNGKVLVRGTLSLTTLYTVADENASAEKVLHEIPFSEMVEAEQVNENSRVSVSLCVKELSATPRGDMNGDTKIISLDAVIGIFMQASESTHVTLIEDCYSTAGALFCQRESAVLSEPVLWENSSFTEQVKAALPGGKKAKEVLTVSAKSLLKDCVYEDGAMHMKGTQVIFLLYRDENGAIQNAVTETPFDRTKPMSSGTFSTDCEVWAEHAEAHVMGDGSVELHITTGYHLSVLKDSSVTYITSCEQQSEDTSGQKKPAIVIYFTEEGDTLWNIAKKYGTTVENIQSANALEGDALSIGQKLFIPKIL